MALQGDPTIFLAGGRLRAAYEFPFNHWYIRPYSNFDVIYTNLSGFRESGPAGFALDVHDSGHISFAVSPMVQIGGRWPAPVTAARRRVFVDTNVLIYASRAAGPSSQAA